MQDFFALWKDADPDIPILKEAKAEYEKLKWEVMFLYFLNLAGGDGAWTSFSSSPFSVFVGQGAAHNAHVLLEDLPDEMGEQGISA
jgi:hypothetical protein